MGGVDLESNNLASWDIFHTTIPKTDRFFSLFYDREMGAMNYSSFMYASFGHYNFKKKRVSTTIVDVTIIAAFHLPNSVYIMNGFFIMHLVRYCRTDTCTCIYLAKIKMIDHGRATD